MAISPVRAYTGKSDNGPSLFRAWHGYQNTEMARKCPGYTPGALAAFHPRGPATALFHQHPNDSDFVQIKGQWITGTYYFTTEISSSSTPRWVRADSLDASGQPRGPRKGSNGEGVYSLELRTGNEIQLQNDARPSTLGNACLFDAQP